jgi:transcriptional regulator with XRE-family HTH domain
MARAALGWGMKDLAERAGVSANTIDRFENGRAAPIPANLKALRQAFEDAGVRFTETGGVEPRRGD